MNRKLQVKRTVSAPPSPAVRSASTVQRASGDDHDARLTRWWKRIFLSMPFSAAVSRT